MDRLRCCGVQTHWSTRVTKLFAAIVFAVATAASSVLPEGAVERTATGVRLVRDGRVIWNFEIDAEDGKPYIHPLTTPSGETLTDVRPADHPWHKGLWFSWKFLNGVNYWETPDKCGPGGAGITVVTSKAVDIQGLGATVRLGLAYRAADGDVMSERRVVTFSPPEKDGSYAIIFDQTFKAVTDVTIDRTPPYRRHDGAWAGGYAGLTLRLSASAARHFSRRRDFGGDVTFANPDNGECIRLRAIDQPASGRFYAWLDRRMLNLSPVYDNAIKLSAGSELHLRGELRLGCPE